MRRSDVVRSLGLLPHPEGGYFTETFRSGAVPMSSNGFTDFKVPTAFLTPTSVSSSSSDGILWTGQNRDHSNLLAYEAMCLSPNRRHRRPDKDIRRNCLTSIVWMPTREDPKLPLGVNCSDIVHYYQGGNPFKYIIYDKRSKELTIEILGNQFDLGHKLQVSVGGGKWKCGEMVPGPHEISLIGEAVAPGFDYHDFSEISPASVDGVEDDEIRELLTSYISNSHEVEITEKRAENK